MTRAKAKRRNGIAKVLRAAPRVLTAPEQRKLLKATEREQRDHVLFSLALGTALRESELAALNVGDLYHRGKPRRRITLRVFKGSKRKDGARGRHEVLVSKKLWPKLIRYRSWMLERGHPFRENDPVFVSQLRRRIATRTIRHLFGAWQERCGFTTRYTFHELRHTSISNLYGRTKSIRAAQRLARHAHVTTTEVYAHVPDEEFFAAVDDLPC